MRGVAILNEESGGLRNIDGAAYARYLRQVFADQNHDLEVRQVSGSELEAALDEVAASEAELLVAAGGDGTISTAAGKMWRANKVLGVLPAGTVNLVARSLKIPLELEEAARALAEGDVLEADIATANGTPFMHQFSVGLQTELVKEREQLTYGSRFGKMLASFRAALAAISRPPRFEVGVDLGQGSQTRVLSGLAISNNPYGEGHLPYADRLDQGILGIYSAAPLTMGAAARLTTDLMMGSWRANDDFKEDTAEGVVLEFSGRRRPSQAVLDGELIPLEERIEITLHRKALRILRPLASKFNA